MCIRYSPYGRFVSEALRLDGPIMWAYRVWRRVWTRKAKVRTTDPKTRPDAAFRDGEP